MIQVEILKWWNTVNNINASYTYIIYCIDYLHRLKWLYRAYEYTWIYYFDIFDTSNSPTDFIQILMLLRAATTSYSSGLQATKLNSTGGFALRNLETKVAWGKPWETQFVVVGHRVFHTSFLRENIWRKKKKSSPLGVKSKKNCWIYRLVSYVWCFGRRCLRGFLPWGMCCGRSNSSHFTIIGKMFICLLAVVEYSWHSLKMIFMTSQDGSSRFLGHWTTVAHIQPRYKASSSKALMDETSWIRNSLKERSLGITTR